MTRHAEADVLTGEQAQALAGRLPGLRAQRGWSQLALSLRSGVPQSHIARAELGTGMTAERARKIAGALGVTPAQLHGPGDLPPVAPKPRREPLGFEDGLRAAREMRRLRQERGITAQQMAGACGRGARSWTDQKETMRSRITRADLLVIEEALGVPPGTLLGDGTSGDRVTAGRRERTGER